MIHISPLTSRLHDNLSKIDAPIKRIEKRITACINDLNESFNAFWSLPDDQINEILENLGIEGIQNIFKAHDTNGNFFNQLLESRGVSSPRTILVVPREIEIINGNFQVVPLPEALVVLEELIPE